MFFHKYKSEKIRLDKGKKQSNAYKSSVEDEEVTASRDREVHEEEESGGCLARMRNKERGGRWQTE